MTKKIAEDVERKRLEEIERMKKAKEAYELKKAQLKEKDRLLREAQKGTHPMIYMVPIIFILMLGTIAYLRPQWLTFGKSRLSFDL